MVLEFTKMNGAGNDFVLLDNRARKINLTREQIVHICHRHKGVGADGIILLTPCKAETADWAWKFFNRDGSNAEMCGNGARCFARYVRKLTGIQREFTFQTGAGVITASFDGERPTVSLTKPRDLRLNEVLQLSTGEQTVHSLNTGVPHAVVFVPDADQALVKALGREIREHEHFAPKGTNVNFVQLLGPNSIRVRTYERGVEGETLACGTGVTASAMVASSLHDLQPPVKVLVKSGDTLEVGFRRSDDKFFTVTLSGPADFVFEGKIKLE